MVLAIGAQRHCLSSQNLIPAKASIEMRKQGAASGGLPAQIRAKLVSLYREQPKPGLISEVLRRRFPNLARG